MVLTNLMSTTGMNNNKKKTKGRKKIELKKIEEANSRQVTFSKRRTGLFKKASELCILTGAQVAILVTSPGGKDFAFGHPNIDSLLDRYNNNNNNNNNNNMNNYPPPRLPVKELNDHYVDVSQELEAEKKRGEMIPSSSSSTGGSRWFEVPTHAGMEVGELEQLLWSLGELRKKVVTRADELKMINKVGPSVFNDGWFNGGLTATNVVFNDQTGWFNGGLTVGVPTNGGGFMLGEMPRF